MIAHDSGIVWLLESRQFRRSRLAAAALVDDPKGLAKLMATVEARRCGIVPMDNVTTAVDFDIACAVVEARIEELHECPTTVGAAYSCRRGTRLRLVIAVLHYLVGERARPGRADDAAVLRWIARVTQGEIPAY